MTGPEQGFLLLTSQLGDPDRKPLTIAQFRNLAKRVQNARRDVSTRELCPGDLMQLGYEQDMVDRIYGLLAGGNQLRTYLNRGTACGCYPVTRLNPNYPRQVRRRMGLDSPGVLWAKGDVTLLQNPAIACIGSRDLQKENRSFACAVGKQAAGQGYVLVSGNAKGADQAAQDACLEAGGSVISVVADSLQDKPLRERMLYLSLEDFDQPFSAARALRRNHVIHTLGQMTIAAQCTLGTGGTWDGILTNLKKGWNSVYLLDDGSDAAMELENRGVQLIREQQLADLPSLIRSITLFD